MITGIGERKAELYGNNILHALELYRSGARAAEMQTRLSPMQETLALLQQGKTLAEIAAARGRQISTVTNTVAMLIEAGDVEFSSVWIDPGRLSVIEAACMRLKDDGYQRLKPLKDMLPPEITYEEIRLVVARIRRQHPDAGQAPAGAKASPGA